jgi:B9 domain-containing protein 1
MSEAPTSFFVTITGQVESARLTNCSNLYIKYEFVYGADWEVVRSSGEQIVLQDGVTQITSSSGGPDPAFVFNFPVEITFRSTNPHGWPQLIFSVYELDRFGVDHIRGYGRCFMPVAAGQHTPTVQLFAPVSSSPIQRFIAFVTRASPVLIDPKFVARSEGREVTRMAAQGSIRLKLNVVMRNMDFFGYTTSSVTRSDPDPLFRFE